MRTPCVKCGNVLHTGEGRVIVSFSADELEEIAISTADPAVSRRAICALGLLDAERAERLVGLLR